MIPERAADAPPVAPQGGATLPETVYSAESRILRPGELLRGMGRDLLAARELAWRLFVRNVSARYRQTLLGWLWTLLPPVAATFAFLFLRRTGVVLGGPDEVPYPLFLFASLVLWLTFVDALNAPVRMVSQSRSLLTKINFPREALILAGVAEVLFNFVVRSAPLVAALLWFGAGPAKSATLFPLGVLVLVALGVALGLALVPLAVLVQDVEHGLSIGVTLWMFMTPVFYAAPAPGSRSLAMLLNPVAPVLDTARAWLLTGEAGHIGLFGAVAAFSAGLLMLAWLGYRLALPILIERMSA